MPETADNLDRFAAYIRDHGFLQGNRFGDPATGQLDIAATAFLIGEGRTVPEFFSDDMRDIDRAVLLIEASAPTMQILGALARTAYTPQSVTPICPGHEVPDYLATVITWTTEGIPIGTQPPSVSEVIGVILRAAQNVRQTVPVAA